MKKYTFLLILLSAINTTNAYSTMGVILVLDKENLIQQIDPYIYKYGKSYCYSENIEMGCVMIDKKDAEKAIEIFVGG